MGTVKYTGPVASFHCPTNAEIRSLKVHFSPKQLGEGDPSPENVRPIEGWDGVEQYYSGKNMGHIVGYSAITLSNPHNKKSVTNNYGTTLSTVNPERSVIITQSQIQDASNIGSYKNGYMAIELDNLIFDTPYDISFKVTNITSNPLNATLQNLGLGIPNGTRRGPTEIRDNILIYKNFPFNQRDIYPNQIDFDLRICGMSFTLSDFMVTPANTNDGVYEPYTQKRIVKWNQWLPALTDENWQAYNSNYINTTFENGVATSTWLTNNSGYQASVRTKNGVLQKNKEIWYLSYMLKTSMSGGSWGAEFNGGLQNTSVYNLEANIWTRCSECSIYWRGTKNYTYISYYRAGIDEHTGMVAQVKSPIFINLTQMFGAGNEPSKEEFEEQCALNGIDLTSTLPYDEGSIREWKTNGALLKNSIIFPVLGKNKFNINAPFAEPSDTSSSSSVARIFQPYTYCLGLSASNGYLPDRITDFSISNNTLTFSTINTSYGVGFAIPLQPGSYRMTYTGENVTRTLVCYNNEGNIVATNIDSQGIFYINPKVSIAIIIFRSSTANTPTTVSNIQIEEGITSTEYEEFNPNHTVYGGWVELISGEVVSTYLYCKIKDLPGEWNYRSGNNRFQITLSNYFANAPSVGTWTHFATSEVYKTSTSNGYGNKQIATYIDKHIYIRDDDFEGDVEAFLNEVGDTYITYELAESTTYSLSPTSMQTFLAQNNIWSNADYVEVEYDLYETQNILARKQFIMANQPHIVKPAAAPLQNFVTDVAAPLKECKAYFNPVQDTSNGVPSPNNICPISGWTGLEVTKSGKNLFNKDTVINNSWIRAENLSEENPLGTIKENASGYTLSQYISVYPNTTYTIKYNIASQATAAGMVFFSEQDVNSAISGISLYYQTYINSSTTREYYTFTTPINCHYIRVTTPPKSSDIQLELGSTATTYEPYTGTILPIDWTTEAGTVYGGYVDLMTGEVWETYYEFIVDGTLTPQVGGTSYNGTEATNRFFLLPKQTPHTSPTITVDDDLFCNKAINYKRGTWTNPNSRKGEFCINAFTQLHVVFTNDVVGIAEEDNQSDRSAKIKAWLTNNPMTFILPLRVPTLIATLTPTQLKTLRGTNNIWSNSNGDITVQFWKH